MDDRSAEWEHDVGRPPFPSLDEEAEAVPRSDRIELGNRLLDGLEGEARSLLQPHLERTTLAEGQVLEEERQPSAFLYFPTSGGVSFEAGPGSASLQLALIGREGLVGAWFLLGGVPLSKAVVQFEGAAWRVPTGALDACLERSPRLHRQLLLGVNAFLGRLSLTAWANGRAMVENRLARWLLAATACLDSDEICVTHRMLSDALGVRRPSITIALHALKRRGAICSRRGNVRILDRLCLAAVAGDHLSSGAA